MKSTTDVLEERISAAMAQVTGRQDCAAIVRPATDPRFGDYQANGVMALAKQIKTNPRKLAEAVVEQLDLSDICEPPEVAGPGFINLRLKPAVHRRATAAHPRRYAGPARHGPDPGATDHRCGFLQSEHRQGDARRPPSQHDHRRRHLPPSRFLGHKVIRQNHIGDWGTQFGMLILLMASVHGSRSMAAVRMQG